MKNTEQLIASLVENAAPVRQSRSPVTMSAWWLTASFIYIAAVLAFMGVRDDIAAKIHTPLFAAELILLLSIVASSGISATVLSFPDLFQKRALAWAPVLPLIAFIVLLVFEALNDIPPAPLPVHGPECLLCITLLSLLPGAVMLFILRGQASVHYYTAGAVALIAACGIGCLTLRLSEKTDSIHHLVEWHYLPMIGFGILGLALGRKFLKW